MIAPETLATNLESLIGAAYVDAEGDQLRNHAIDGGQPSVVARPATIEQAAEVVAWAGRERLAVVPWGQGTQMHVGAPPQRYDIALDLSGLNRVLEYDAANLTLIAEAGTPLREVYRLTVPERQFLPLGYPGTQASLGGLLVTNTSGFKRARYGGMRDLALGVRVALPDGALVRFGGRVVKNVAGYDMNKLYVGSYGAFGVVLATSYRLAALPEDDRFLAAVFPTLAQATEAAAAVQASLLHPAAVMLLDHQAAQAMALPLTLQPGQVVLLFNFDGLHEAVERELRESEHACQRSGMTEAAQLAGEELLRIWEQLEQWQTAPGTDETAQLRLRIGALPSRLVAAVETLETTQTFGLPGSFWYADYVHGQVYACLYIDPQETVERVVPWLAELRQRTRDWHGYCQITAAPAKLRRQLDIWGETPGMAALHRRYKDQFDPHAVLNPGRYIASL
ncbi:FAD-binding oxidoreductase [Candidatus Entotheonella palauensis]|uniref:FAD-binding oxidoreductase n=1 Tax=Candidatus Entotheonella palauensis TaxID=93172 RepID=UPI000B7D0FCF|nr:FAD-binding oxidoreductase [Candidatus Entotheonella palauensis]